MSDTENTQEPKQATASPEQIQLVRESLIQSIFKDYHELIGKLKKLPIQHALPLVTKAYLDIDCAMLVFKEILSSGLLMFAQAPEKKEEPNENNEEKPEDQNDAA